MVYRQLFNFVIFTVKDFSPKKPSSYNMAAKLLKSYDKHNKPDLSKPSRHSIKIDSMDYSTIYNVLLCTVTHKSIAFLVSDSCLANGKKWS